MPMRTRSTIVNIDAGFDNLFFFSLTSTKGKEERDNNKRRRAAGPAAGLQHRSRRLLRTARCLAYGLGGGVPFAGWGWRFVRHLASRLSCGSTTRAGTG